LATDENITISGLPAFSPIVGCGADVSGDQCIHIGALFIRKTACGLPIGDVLMTGSFTVDCPECKAEIRYRNKHPECANERMGIITHRRG